MVKPIAMPEDKEVARLGKLPIAVISDSMDRLGIPTAVMAAAIARCTGTRMAGRARTIDRVVKPSNATQAQVAPDLAGAPQQFIDEAKAGEVLVMAVHGETSVACIGDNMSTRSLKLGVAGIVIDGCMRDTEVVGEMGLTVFTRGVICRSAAGRLVTLSLNQPVICGGVYVVPGDVVVGDADGVIVVPKDKAAEVADMAEKLEVKEGQSKKFIEEGHSVAEAVKAFKVS